MNFRNSADFMASRIFYGRFSVALKMLADLDIQRQLGILCGQHDQVFIFLVSRSWKDVSVLCLECVCNFVSKQK